MQGAGRDTPARKRGIDRRDAGRDRGMTRRRLHAGERAPQGLKPVPAAAEDVDGRGWKQGGHGL